MPGFDGTGPRGMGPMTGGGRGFCSPWGLPAGLGAYGIPRWRGYGYPYYAARPFTPEVMPYPPNVSREQELDFLRSEAEALRQDLKTLENRIERLSVKKE